MSVARATASTGQALQDRQALPGGRNRQVNRRPHRFGCRGNIIGGHPSVIFRASIGRPRLVLLDLTALTLMVSAVALLGGPAALFFDNIEELVAVSGAAAGLGFASRGKTGSTRRLLVAFTVSVAAAALGMLAWDLSFIDESALPAVGDVLFVLAVIIGLAVIVPAIFGGLEWCIDRHRHRGLDLFPDRRRARRLDGDPDVTDDRAGLIGLVVPLAAIAACAFALVGRRIRPTWGVPWTLLAGGAIVGASWLSGLATPAPRRWLARPT